MEEGESDETALVRELREELQVEGQVMSQDPVAVGLDGPVEVHTRAHTPRPHTPTPPRHTHAHLSVLGILDER